jgi:deazaflavin-dependent oxidoreductase (nitroreductase family)
MSSLMKNKPKGLLRWALRAPRWLYHAGFGWLLGERFLLLRYTGRKTGLARETIIEVVDHDREQDTYYAASGWGAKSDWFLSIRASPEVQIQVGKRKMTARAYILDLEEAARHLCLYAKHHPAAFRELSKMMVGKTLQGTNQECMDFARSIPVIAFLNEEKGAKVQ